MASSSSDSSSAKAVVAALRAEGKNAPKPLCFNLRNQLKEEDFARAFAEEGGLDALMGVAVQATGNVQTYALIALRVAISHSSGAEGTLRKEELLEQLVELLEAPLVPVVKQVAEILGVLSCSGPSSWRRIHQATKKSAKGREKKPYASLVQCIVAHDLDLQVNTLVLMNNLLSAAPERMRKFLIVWRDLGAEDKLKTVAQSTKYEALIAQVQQYQRKLLTAFPEAARIIDDPSSPQQTSPTPATTMSRTRRGTITIAKKVEAAVGTLRKRDKEKDAKESPKSSKKEVDGEEDHGGEATPIDGEGSGVKEKEKEKEAIRDEQHSKDEPNGEKEEKQQKAKKKKKKQHKVAKKECEADNAGEREHQKKTTVEEEKPSASPVSDTFAADLSAAELPSLASETQSPSSLDEVKAMRDKMLSLAGQVEKLKEVGKALVQKKESEIQALKKELGELSEENNRHKRELEGFRREQQRKEEMAVHAEERNKRESVVLESKRSRKGSSPSQTASPVLEASPSRLSSSPSLASAKELEDLRAEVEGLKKELGEMRTENDDLKKAEKQRAVNAALLVKEMKAEEKHYASTAEMLDDFQKMKEQVMKLQLLKEQVIKEMRQIKKTAFVGFPEFGDKLSGIDGLEMKQIQQELERERKEKEAAQAEVLLLKTKISEIGSPEEVEELRKRNAELVQTNQKVTKENTALRVSMLESRMKSKQDASKQAAPSKSKEDVERLETELGHKDREVEEEKAGKEKALTQLKTMMKVMKVLKTKYDTELETRKQVESELATLREQLRERLEQPQEEKTKTKKKKGKESDAEEDETKTFKRRAKELEEEKAKWAKERGDLELRLEESQKNEYTSTNAAFSLNDQVEKLEAELDALRAERQETTLQDKVARLEKEKRDLQDHFGKELNELRGQTASLYEADIEKLKEEVTRLQREKQMACQLLVSSNDKLKKMEGLLDTFKKDAARP